MRWWLELTAASACLFVTVQLMDHIWAKTRSRWENSSIFGELLNGWTTLGPSACHGCVLDGPHMVHRPVKVLNEKLFAILIEYSWSNPAGFPLNIILQCYWNFLLKKYYFNTKIINFVARKKGYIILNKSQNNTILILINYKDKFICFQFYPWLVS